MPRILDYYTGDCFTFSDNFLRMAFPAPEQPTGQATEQVSETLRKSDVSGLKRTLKGKLTVEIKNLNCISGHIEPVMQLRVDRFYQISSITSR